MVFRGLSDRHVADSAPEAHTFAGLNLKLHFGPRRFFWSQGIWSSASSDVCQQTVEELLGATTTISPTTSKAAKLNSGLECKPLQSRSWRWT